MATPQQGNFSRQSSFSAGDVDWQSCGGGSARGSYAESEGDLKFSDATSVDGNEELMEPAKPVDEEMKVTEPEDTDCSETETAKQSGDAATGVLEKLNRLPTSRWHAVLLFVSIGCVVGCIVGAICGFLGGLVIGLLLSIFTFGVSIPVGIVAGWASGAASGIAIGALMGGIAAYYETEVTKLAKCTGSSIHTFGSCIRTRLQPFVTNAYGSVRAVLEARSKRRDE